MRNRAVAVVVVVFLAMHAIVVRRVKIRGRNDLLSVESVRGVAFRFVCSCGDRGPSRKLRVEAVGDGRAHRIAHGFLEGE